MNVFKTGVPDEVVDPGVLIFRDFVRHVLATRDEDLSAGRPYRYTRIPDGFPKPEVLAKILHDADRGAYWMVVPESPAVDAPNWIGPSDDWRPEGWRLPPSQAF
ncbi:RusA-like resolvase [Gordonia phage SpeedDemon]|uniref:Uncharacterized protein n=1 Tax=Gordonia phage Bantam TaxID=1887641 RepID=A0A1B3AYE4_9CAUD|nr:resolvase [Gordonia phage Bantam]AOE43762.1 hypothetical protein SEA_BANTAM_73 [Gordonia phage Bantam]QNL30525.1 RusA-like resolvase [Gordonia phage SpeedDemon]